MNNHNGDQKVRLNSGEDPLEFFFRCYKPEISEISDFVFGEKYCAVMLRNGNTGVCAVQEMTTFCADRFFEQPDLLLPGHRIFYHAWLNAALNYDNLYKEEKDIFDCIDFSHFRKIVMLGYFASLNAKFDTLGIHTDIYDLHKKDGRIRDMAHCEKDLADADAVILTATSVTNGTFLKMTELTRDGCQIFVLGPSSILHEKMFGYKNIAYIFGSVFDNGDKRILDIVGNGGGTPDFMHRMKKVYLKKPFSADK